jgi:hypothetical protein
MEIQGETNLAPLKLCPPTLTINKSAFYNYVFGVILSVNSDYFVKQR